MLDTETIRNEAFQHLHALPHFSADVILLIEELERARETIAVKDNMLDDDARIIHGLVEHYRRMETMVVLGKKLAEGFITKEAYDIAWNQFEELIIARP